MNDFEKRVFGILISCEIGTQEVCYAPLHAVVPISDIARFADCSRYKARSALKSLISKGYVEYTHQGQPAIESNTENGCELICEAGPPINGYALTKQGFSTDEYKQALDDSIETLRKWAEGD